jgi:probable F420-dependent oxidoreductase
MIELAAARTRGTHPYLVPAAHTTASRAALGPGAVIAQELSVILEPDPEAARALARRDLQAYLGLPNYTNTWKRFGFTDADLADGGSDALVDALYGWGTVTAIGERIQEYRDAGADHVCLRVAYDGPERLPLAEWGALAELLKPPSAPAR